MKKYYKVIIAMLLLVGCSDSEEQSPQVESKVIDTNVETEEDVVDFLEVIDGLYNNYLDFSFSATDESLDVGMDIDFGFSIGRIAYYKYDANNKVLSEEIDPIFQEGDPAAQASAEITRPKRYYDLNAGTMHDVSGNIGLDADYVATPYEHMFTPVSKVAKILYDFKDEIEYSMNYSDNEITYTISNMGDILNTAQGIERYSDYKLILIFDRDYNIISIDKQFVDTINTPDGPKATAFHVQISFGPQDEITIPTKWVGGEEV